MRVWLIVGNKTARVFAVLWATIWMFVIRGRAIKTPAWMIAAIPVLRELVPRHHPVTPIAPTAAIPTEAVNPYRVITLAPENHAGPLTAAEISVAKGRGVFPAVQSVPDREVEEEPAEGPAENGKGSAEVQTALLFRFKIRAPEFGKRLKNAGGRDVRGDIV
jgi:hypothetical protein